jgi:hypothetical protein
LRHLLADCRPLHQILRGREVLPLQRLVIVFIVLVTVLPISDCRARSIWKPLKFIFITRRQALRGQNGLVVQLQRGSVMVLLVLCRVGYNRDGKGVHRLAGYFFQGYLKGLFQ